jgi:putative ABC transport system permease protein
MARNRGCRLMAVRIALACLRHHRGQVAMACLAVALGVSVPATLLSLEGIRTNFEREVRAYGADLLIVPKGGASLDMTSLAALDGMLGKGELSAYAPFVSFVAMVDGHPVTVAGTRFALAREFYRWASVKGSWPEDPSSALIGANAAVKLRIKVGDAFTVDADGERSTLRTAGLIRTGGSEESQIFVDLGVAQRLIGNSQRLSFVLGQTRRVSEVSSVAAALAQSIPEADVRTPLQVVKAQETILMRLERLFLLVGGIVLVGCTLSVFATVAVRLRERRDEAGVMKALGASRTAVIALLGIETLVAGLAGGVSAYALGLIFAQVISERAFGAFVAPSMFPLYICLGIGLGISLGTSSMLLARTARVNPAAVLRGE